MGSGAVKASCPNFMTKKKKKRKSLGPKPKRSRVKDVVKEWHERGFTSMLHFYRLTDWAALWEQWYLSVDDYGRPKYKRLWDFIRDAGESQEQREFLLWYLGPKDEDWASTPEAKKYSWCKSGPVDWVAKKNSGGWFQGQAAVALSNEMDRRMSALDRLQATEPLSRRFLESIAQLDARLDVEFKNSFFAPGLSVTHNNERALTYVDLKRRLLALYERAHDRYAKTLGINFEDMEGLMHVMQAAALAASNKELSGEAITDPGQKFALELTKATMHKFGQYKISLPDSIAKDVVDATAEPLPGKKHKVN